MPGVTPQSLAVYPPVLTGEDCAGVLRAEMEQGQRLHGRIEVAALLPSTARATSLTGLERAVSAARAHLAERVLPLADQLRAIDRAARKAGRGDVARAAAEFAALCGAVSWEADYQAARGAILARLGRTELMVDDAAARLIRGGQSYETSAQRAQDWQDLIRPEGHRLSQIVSALPEYRSRFWHKFKMFQSFDIEALKLEGAEEIDRIKRAAVLAEALRQAQAIAEHRPEET